MAGLRPAVADRGLSTAWGRRRPERGGPVGIEAENRRAALPILFRSTCYRRDLHNPRTVAFGSGRTCPAGMGLRCPGRAADGVPPDRGGDPAGRRRRWSCRRMKGCAATAIRCRPIRRVGNRGGDRLPAGQPPLPPRSRRRTGNQAAGPATPVLCTVQHAEMSSLERELLQ